MWRILNGHDDMNDHRERLERRITKIVDDHIIRVIIGNESAFVSVVNEVLRMTNEAFPGDDDAKRRTVRYVLDEIETAIADTFGDDRYGPWIVAELSVSRVMIRENFETLIPET